MKIIQQAFMGDEPLLKGGLHTHTTRSDGQLDPADLIRVYHAHGYDFLALTDHCKYNYKNFAPEIPITIIPGMEYDSMIEYNGYGFKQYHTVCIGPSMEDGNGYAQDQIFESGDTKTQEEYQPYLDGFHANHNLTIHCHPEWCSTSAQDYDNLQGSIAMEIYNTSCALLCDMDKDASYWDELLGAGKRIWGVASDDAHSTGCCCKGWVMVRARNTVNDILAALRDGKFYASCGPEIYNFYVDDDMAVIDCSPVEKIRLHGYMHPGRVVRDENGNLTHAEFQLTRPWPHGGYTYARMSVVDKEGKMAWTNPIFLD